MSYIHRYIVKVPRSLSIIRARYKSEFYGIESTKLRQTTTEVDETRSPDKRAPDLLPCTEVKPTPSPLNFVKGIDDHDSPVVK